MTRPSLSAAVSWTTLQNDVDSVFREALVRLSRRPELPRAEVPINLELYREALQVRLEFSQRNLIRLPFVILLEANNQPESDDQARSTRLEKRPDFTCAMFNDQAPDVASSQIYYVLECKRLGTAEGSWVFNDNYSEHGIRRFVHLDWQYAKNCPAATMIGYLQGMMPSSVLSEVNVGTTTRSLPQLSAPTTGWTSTIPWSVQQPSLARSFPPNSFQLRHLWIDLRGCKFVTPPPTSDPPGSALVSAASGGSNSSGSRAGKSSKSVAKSVGNKPAPKKVQRKKAATS